MKNILPALNISLRLWFHTALCLSIIIILYFLPLKESPVPLIILLTLPVTLIASIPALVILSISIVIIAVTSRITLKTETLAIICFAIAVMYGCFAGLVFPHLIPGFNIQYSMMLYTAIISFSILLAFTYNSARIKNYFSTSQNKTTNQITSKTNQYMETISTEKPVNEGSNKVLIKGLITGILILVMLIPTWFVNSLIEEREQRQKEIVQEVSSKWASSQRISGPYISMPYMESYQGKDGKVQTIKRNIIFLPENLTVNSKIFPEEAHRSIYHVLLYRTQVNATGSFNIKIPDDIVAANLDYSKAKICLGITDYKGIEQKVSIQINNAVYNLAPGLPTSEIDAAGLSASLNLTSEDFTKPIAFTSILKLKGSSQLRFLPLSANSQFHLSSLWPDPSFDGNSLPSERKVSDSGFAAKWNFNEANLPFGNVVREGSFKATDISFGVNMLQPADQYAKTMRSVKYAILFIGLTFALFFIVELMQKKPVHPVQYILVGLGLVIFYTLLLSISEFIAFDAAYMIAAAATVLLITLYAKGHFQSWKVASVFAMVLGILYGFIFTLIRLEDTALLVGSVGLFIVLAIVMYFSRKIDWYGYQPKPTI
jgi:inner membrane protein